MSAPVTPPVSPFKPGTCIQTIAHLAEGFAKSAENFVDGQMKFNLVSFMHQLLTQELQSLSPPALVAQPEPESPPQA